LVYLQEFSVLSVNLLKPTGHVMHQQFNVQKLYEFTPCPHYIYVFCIYLGTNNKRVPGKVATTRTEDRHK